MKKLVTLLLPLALVVGACGGGPSEVAATVDGVDITVGQIQGLIDTGDDSTVDKDVFAQYLNFEVQTMIVSKAAEDEFGIDFSDDEVETKAADIVSSEADSGTTRAEFLSANGVTEEFLQVFARQQLVGQALEDALTEQLPEPTQDEIDTVIDDASQEVCASHILVQTEQEANDVLDRLDSGEDFATVASDVSLDAGSSSVGGDLGCADPATYVAEFADALDTAEIGVPTQPVQTQYGWHIILKRETELPTEDEAADQVRSDALAGSMENWLLDKLTNATVEVNEKYGTWQTDPTPQLVAPDG